MGGFSLVHWIILGIVVLLLFGGNRFSAMMGDVAKGLKSFKQGMSEDDTKPAERPPERAALQQERPPIDITPQAARPLDPTMPPSTTPPPTTPPPAD